MISNPPIVTNILIHVDGKSIDIEHFQTSSNGEASLAGSYRISVARSQEVEHQLTDNQNGWLSSLIIV